jgi:probable F420-dependent oxidoreductase
VPHFGVSASKEEIKRTCEVMEELGGDSVWVGDHIVVPYSFSTKYPYSDSWYDPKDPPPYMEAFSVLAYLAAITSRITIGTSVTVLPYRHPLLTAKALATIDVLSDGRLAFGAGVGWFSEEFDALGLSSFKDRGRVADEQLEIIRRCWTQDRPSFQGVYYKFDELSVKPKPLQRPHPPILIGGNGPHALRRAARFGDLWHGMSMLPSEVTAAQAELTTAAALNGRNEPPGTSLFMKLVLTAKPSSFEKLPEERRREALTGTPDQLVNQLRAYRDVGLDQLISRIDSDGSFGAGIEPLSVFLSEVWPAVNGLGPRG